MNKEVNRKKISIPILSIVLVIILITIIAIGVVFFINKNNDEIIEETISRYNYFKLFQNEKYGVLDEKGNVLIEAKYDVVNIPNPTKPVFICYYDYNDDDGEYKTIVLNEKNEKILTEYEKVEPLICEESSSNIPFEKSVLKYKENGKFGIIDFEGQKITEAIYEEIESMKYREGTLLVKENSKYGAIDLKGRYIIKNEYDNIESDGYYIEKNKHSDSGFIVQIKFEDGYKYGYINKKGKKIIEPDYNEIKRITEIKSDDIFLLVSKNGKYGIIKNKKIILDSEYEDIEYNKANQLFVIQKDSKQGIANINGKEIIEMKYDYILCGENKITTQKGDSIEIFDAQGNRKDSKFDNSIQTANENYIITIDDEEKFGISNKNGDIIIPNKYEYLEYAFEDYFIATKLGMVGVINIEDKTVIDFKYNIIQVIKDKKMLQAIVSGTNTTQIYNNELIYQVTINQATLYTYDNYVKIISDRDMAYLDNNGNVILNKEIFKENTLFAYNKNGKWGYANVDDKIMIIPEYDMVTEFNQYGYAGVKKDDKWGVIGIDGKIIVKPSYKIDWLEPEFIGKYCKLNFGYGFEYYTDELVD